MAYVNPYLEGNPFMVQKPPKATPGMDAANMGLKLYTLKKKSGLKVPSWKIGEAEPGQAMNVTEPTVGTEGLDAFSFGKGGEGLGAPGAVEETGAPLFDTEAPTLLPADEAVTGLETIADAGIDEAVLLGAEEAAMLGASEATPTLTALESSELAGLGASTVEIAPAAGGATAGSVLGVLGEVAPYAVIGDYLAKHGGAYIERKTGGKGSSNVFSQFGRTMQDPWQGIGRPWVKEVFHKEDAKNIGTVMDVLNPAGWVFRKIGCIIVTACTSPDSEEVGIAREYRDRFLTAEQLRGYYMIAEKVTPVIIRFSWVKWFVKRFLVDKLVSHGRYALGYGPYGETAWLVAKYFLKLCRFVGSRRASFIRCNGEEV